MKIGFDVSQTGKEKAGCGYVADSLIRRIAEEDHENFYFLYSSFGTGFWDPDHSRSTCNIRKPNFKRIMDDFSYNKAQAFWKKQDTSFEDRLGNPDIVHANNFFCPTGLKKARLVYMLYDLSFFDHPEWTTEANRCICFEGLFNAAIHADMIISISLYSKNHFLKIFPFYPEDRIRVTYLGSRFSETDNEPPELNLSDALPPGKFWLAVGTLEPRKNLRRLLRVFARAKKEHDYSFVLALAGGKGWLEEELPNFISSLGIEKNVHLLGYVNDNQLSWLYRNCFAFIYPSLFEGFGLPVLEAMSLGAAVITSNTSSLPEVAGEAALTVNPMDEKTILTAILKMRENNNLRIRLQEKSLEQARRFSWGKMAEEVLKVYQEVVRRNPWCPEK